MLAHFNIYCNFTLPKTHTIMKRIWMFFVPVLTLLLLSSDQDPLEGILKKHHEAAGKERFSTFKTIKRTGVIKRGTIDFPFVSYQKGTMFRLEEQFGDKTAVSVFDGKEAWKITPWEPTRAVTISGKELAELKELSLAAGVLTGYETYGYTTELLETTDQDANAKIKLQASEKSWYVVFVNKETGLIEGWKFHDKSTSRKSMVKTDIVETMVYEGVRFPSMMKKIVGGKEMTSISVNTIEVDIEVNNKLFKKP